MISFQPVLSRTELTPLDGRNSLNWQRRKLSEASPVHYEILYEQALRNMDKLSNPTF
jgi:hypothetical protein